EVGLVERHERHDHGKTADELRDEAVLQQIVGHDLLEDGARLFGVVAERRAETHRLLADARLDDLLEALERAAAAERDVRRAGLGEAGRVGDRERHVEDARERLREKRLAAAGRADEQNVRLAELDVVDAVAGRDALVMVVDRHRQRLLRLILPDDVLVEDLVDAPWARDLLPEGARLRRLHELLVHDLAAERDALVADVDALPRDQLADLVLA